MPQLLAITTEPPHRVTVSSTGSSTPVLRATLGDDLALSLAFTLAGEYVALSSVSEATVEAKAALTPSGDTVLVDASLDASGSSASYRLAASLTLDSAELFDLIGDLSEIELSLGIRIAHSGGLIVPEPLRLVVVNTPARGEPGLPTALETLWTRLKAMLSAGSNVTFTDNNTTRVRTIAASGGGTVDASSIAAVIHAGTSKATPVDSDEIGISDSAASWGFKKLTWANLKATLKTYFDALYSPAGHTHAISGVIGLQTELDAKASASALDDKADAATFTDHASNTSNPHSVTKSQVGLGNCDNTSDANKPISTATQTALDAKLSADGNGSALTALNASALGSGTVPTARLGSGSASSSTFLRGDNSWQSISGGQTTEERDLEAINPAQIQLLWTGVGQTSSNTGSGGTTATGHNVIVTTGSTANSRAQYLWPSGSSDVFLGRSGAATTTIDWSKPVSIGFAINVVSTSANAVFRLKLANNYATVGELSGAGLALKISNLTLVAQAHNGSAITTSSTLLTASTSQIIIVQMRSDGAGTLKVWINRTLAATLSGMATAEAAVGVAVECLNNADASTLRVHQSRLFIRVGA